MTEVEAAEKDMTHRLDSVKKLIALLKLTGENW